MIEEALRRLGIENATFVEFGASNGRENCTRNVLDNGGSGLWLEGDPSAVDTARRENADKPVDIVKEFLTIDNINELIASSRVGAGFDLLVVDVDGNDWWLAREILGRWSPRLIVTEYNPVHGHDGDWVMPYDPNHEWRHDDVYGASVRGYERLMKHHGYTLVACDSRAVNAFWVRRGDARLFTSRPGARRHFVPALPGSRHRRHQDVTIDEALSPEQLAAIIISDHRVERVKGTNKELHSVRIENNSDVAISSFGYKPIRIGISDDSAREPERLHIETTIPAGGTGEAVGILAGPGSMRSAAVVQEGVVWGTFQSLDRV